MTSHLKDRILAFAKTHPNVVHFVEKKADVNVKPKTNVTPMAGTVISASTAINQLWIDSAQFPVEINSGTKISPTIVTLIEDITLHTVDSYFNLASEYIIFDGQGHTVNFDIPMTDLITSFLGMFTNGTGVEGESNNDAFDNICIKNINIIVDYSVDYYIFPDLTPFHQGSFFTQAYFGVGTTNVWLQNLHTNTDALSSGAILASFSTANICSSSSTGIIGFPLLQLILEEGLDGFSAGGGIIGSFCTNCKILKCFTSGRIGIASGGLTGIACSNVEIDTSYAVGSVFVLAGGLLGAGADTCTVTNSYSNQSPLTPYSGSIGGLACSGCTIDNCYTATYTNGLPQLFALEQGDNVATHVYSYTSWSNENARLILQNRCNKNFTEIGCNAYPFLLTAFDKHNYVENHKTIKSCKVAHSEDGKFANTNYMILSVNGESPSKYPKIWIDYNTGRMTFDRIEYKCHHKFDIKVLSYQLIGGNYVNYQISDYHLKVCKC